MWTTLHFRVRGKTKKTARDICERALDIEFERDRSIGLGSTLGDDHTDRQTDRQTHTHKHTFLDCGSDVEWKIIKKSKSNFLTIEILPSLLMSLKSKHAIGYQRRSVLNMWSNTIFVICKGVILCVFQMTLCTSVPFYYSWSFSTYKKPFYYFNLIKYLLQYMKFKPKFVPLFCSTCWFLSKGAQNDTPFTAKQCQTIHKPVFEII